MGVGRAPQLVPVNLARLDGCHALMDLYMVDMIPGYDGSNPLKRFVSSGRQTSHLTQYQDLEPGDILSNARSPLLSVHLEARNPHDGEENVALVAESPMTPAPPRPDIAVPPIHRYG